MEGGVRKNARIRRKEEKKKNNERERENKLIVVGWSYTVKAEESYRVWWWKLRGKGEN